MASAQEDGGVADPTGGGSRRIKRNAALAAAEQLERLRCLDMMVEYRQCISAFHQFHQYYVHGEFTHCKIEKSRMYNCIKWKTSQNEEAKEKLLRSFEEEQLSMHTPTPVWRLRDHPPREWNNPDPGGQDSGGQDSGGPPDTSVPSRADTLPSHVSEHGPDN